MSTSQDNPLTPFLRDQGALILDGGLATALEERGFDLDDPLWSARLLIENPAAIRDLHATYLAAGADAIITATYQASVPGFRARGLTDAEGEDLMRLAVHLAVEARERFWSVEENRNGRLRPLVAASVGPYGAFLADGSEYTGDYAATDAELDAFHRERFALLAGTDADLLACETIPSGREARVLLDILRDHPDCPAWLSFSCRDGHLWDGTPLAEVAQACAEVPNAIAIGINCTAPEHVAGLVTAARAVSDKTILVYPNLGEKYDAVTRTWGGGPSAGSWLEAAVGWARLGAGGVGGCCRVGPSLIADLRRRLLA